MPELRRDPVAGRWVIIATERTQRPEEFRATVTSSSKPSTCPFCKGNEAMTPPEIFGVRDNGDWRVRVIPNKFPALKVEGDLDKRGDGIYDLMNGVGAHEVIIEDPSHVLNLTELNEGRVSEVLWVYKQRLLDLKRDSRLVYAAIFKNVGERAGATLEHSHSQLIAMPIVPVRVQAELDRCAEYEEFRGRCLFCDLVRQELSSQVRVVTESQSFVALEPFAPCSPFETHIMPKRHISHFESMDDGLLRELAGVLRTTLLKIDRAIQKPAYNYLLHTAPLNVPALDNFHWHFEIIPRVTRVAGFEWGTGFFINPVPPESAAQFLREVRL